MKTKYRLYKMHVEEDVDISNLEKGLGEILQNENYLSPENAISEQIGNEVDSDNYGIIYSNKKVSKKKVKSGIFGILSKTKKKVELETVVMGNDSQLKIIKDYLISKKITLSFSADVKSASFSFETEIGEMGERTTEMYEKYLLTWKDQTEFQNWIVCKNRSFNSPNFIRGIFKGNVKNIFNLYTSLNKGFCGIKLFKSDISFEF